MGGVAGLLSRHASGVMARLSASQAAQARRLLVRLTTTERTRVERSESELGVEDEDARVALQALVEGRLLQTRTEDGEARYQIAHDSLIQSWPALRGWLDDDVGHRAARQRLEAAGAEWERAGRAQDALLTRRQVDEVRPLDRSALGSRELQLLDASRARLKRRWWLRRLAAGLATLAIASPYASFRFQQWREEVKYVDARLEAAAAELDAAQRLGHAACARREEALVLFDPGPEPGAGAPRSAPRWAAAEDTWSAALAERERAESKHRLVEQSLQSALDRQHRREDARRMLWDATYARLELEECFHPQGAGAESVHRLLKRFNDEDWSLQVEAPAEVEVLTEPPGASVAIEQYVEAGGALQAEPAQAAAGPTPIPRLVLAPGSYRLRFESGGRPPVVFPLLLARGARESIRLALPASVPEGFVYVPPGCFLQGSDDPEGMRRELLGSSPLHRVCMKRGYLIGRTEITFGDWLSYLGSLPPGAPARHVLEPLRENPAGGITLRWQPVSGWVLTFHRSGAQIFSAWEGEPFRYAGRDHNREGDWRQLPLSGVSADDLEGYFAWLDRSGRLRGARLCNEQEWERAARGADARRYPGGDRLSPGDANFDATYGRRPDAYGPDVAGAHPGSASPFGVLDMTGNAMEMVLPHTPELGRLVFRGGGWYYTPLTVLIANRNAGEPTLRNAVLGARTCAPLPE